MLLDVTTKLSHTTYRLTGKPIHKPYELALCFQPDNPYPFITFIHDTRKKRVFSGLWFKTLDAAFGNYLQRGEK